MTRSIHIFDNGIEIYDDHLLAVQRERYKLRNVHEAEEEDIFVELLQAIPPNGCFVNIGTAVGYYPLLAKRLAPALTVHAVEPLAQHRDCFLENIALNGFERSSFIIHTDGISATEGEAEFVDKGYASSIRIESANNTSYGLMSKLRTQGKMLLSKLGIREPVTIQTIKTNTLDNLCKGIGRTVDLCQMDVQGLELEVLKGAPNVLESGEVKTFLIGTHSQNLHAACINRLQANGYLVEYDNFNTLDQPDGILVASKGCQRLSVRTLP